MKSKYIFSLFVLFTYICSCAENRNERNSNKKESDIESKKMIHNYQDSIEIFFKSKGVLVFNAIDKNIKNNIEILNMDKTIFASYNLAKNRIEIDGKSESLSNFTNKNLLRTASNFFPKEFYPELSVIQFEYLKIDNGIAEIILDKKKGIKKLIALNSTLYKIEPWKDHFIGKMIDFNSIKNPLREINLDNGKLVLYESNDDIIFTIDSISEDWVKIICTERCDFRCPEKQTITGWIRWRKGTKMLVHLMYSC